MCMCTDGCNRFHLVYNLNNFVMTTVNENRTVQLRPEKSNKSQSVVLVLGRGLCLLVVVIVKMKFK